MTSCESEQVEEVLGDDAELTAAVLAAQGGDECAFRTVYRAVHPRLLGYVRTLVGEPDAEDVASEAWLQIARDLDRFSGDADRFRGWAARIARNRALDHIRTRGRRPAVGGDETELTGRPAESDTAGEAMEALSTDSTMALIARLPRDQAEAVMLRVVVGLDAKSAARTLGKRPGAVRTAAHRGLKRLAELLGADDLPHDPVRDPGLDPIRDQGPDPVRDQGLDPAYGEGHGQPEYAAPVQTAYGADGAAADDPRTGAGPADPGVDLNGLPPQRVPRTGATAPAGVTHTRLRTQKDM